MFAFFHPCAHVHIRSKFDSNQERKHQCSRSIVEMAVENMDVNMGVDDNMGVAARVNDEAEGQDDFQGYYGESDPDERYSQCTTLDLPGTDGAEDDNAPKTFWEYIFLPAKDPDSVINNVDLGDKSNMYHKTFDGNSKKLEGKKDVWLNVTGIGNSSHKYTFVKAVWINVVEEEYLHYRCSSGKFKDVCFRQIPAPKPVIWESCVNDDNTLVAVQFLWGFTGNPMKVIFLKKGATMTVKKLMDELCYAMAWGNKGSRFQKYKSVLKTNVVLRF